MKPEKDCEIKGVGVMGVLCKGFPLLEKINNAMIRIMKARTLR